MMNFTHNHSTYIGGVPQNHHHVFTFTISDKEISFLIGCTVIHCLLRPRFVDNMMRALAELFLFVFCLSLFSITFILFLVLIDSGKL